MGFLFLMLKNRIFNLGGWPESDAQTPRSFNRARLKLYLPVNFSILIVLAIFLIKSWRPTTNRNKNGWSKLEDPPRIEQNGWSKLSSRYQFVKKDWDFRRERGEKSYIIDISVQNGSEFFTLKTYNWIGYLYPLEN